MHVCTCGYYLLKVDRAHGDVISNRKETRPRASINTVFAGIGIPTTKVRQWKFAFFSFKNMHSKCLICWQFCFDFDFSTQRTQAAMTMSLLRQNDVATSFWSDNYVVIASCVRWECVNKICLSQWNFLPWHYWFPLYPVLGCPPLVPSICRSSPGYHSYQRRWRCRTGTAPHRTRATHARLAPAPGGAVWRFAWLNRYWREKNAKWKSIMLLLVPNSLTSPLYCSVIFLSKFTTVNMHHFLVDYILNLGEFPAWYLWHNRLFEEYKYWNWCWCIQRKDSDGLILKASWFNNIDMGYGFYQYFLSQLLWQCYVFFRRKSGY